MKTAAAREFLEAEPAAAWFALRVAARRPSVSGARLTARVERARRAAGLPPASAEDAEVRIAPRAEFLVEEILLRRGIAAWVPIETRWIRANRYARRKLPACQPVLPGYVLAAPVPDARGAAGPEVNWAELLSCPMVRGVMGFGGRPAPLPPGAIARLREIEARGQARAHHRLMPTGRTFEVGDQVEVLDGPLALSRGKVVEIAPETASVLFTLFGAEREVRLGLSNLGNADT